MSEENKHIVTETEQLFLDLCDEDYRQVVVSYTLDPRTVIDNLPIIEEYKRVNGFLSRSIINGRVEPEDVDVLITVNNPVVTFLDVKKRHDTKNNIMALRYMIREQRLVNRKIAEILQEHPEYERYVHGDFSHE